MNSSNRRAIEKILGWEQRAGRWYNGEDMLPKGYPENLDFENNLNDCMLLVNKLKDEAGSLFETPPFTLKLDKNGLFTATFLTPRGIFSGKASKNPAAAITQAALGAALDNRFEDSEW